MSVSAEQEWDPPSASQTETSRSSLTPLPGVLTTNPEFILIFIDDQDAHNHVFHPPCTNSQRIKMLKGNVVFGDVHGMCLGCHAQRSKLNCRWWSLGHLNQEFRDERIFFNSLPAHPDVGSYLSDCFRGSRDDDEGRILPWVDDTHPELVLCVLGALGLGKSTLAKRLAQQLRKRGRLAGEVYFSFALPDWTAEWVVRMLAGQLCRAFPALMRSVSQAIHLDVGPSIPIADRIEKLILDPIRSLNLTGPLVVILDELDQWAPHPSLIKAFTSLTAHHRLIRFIVLCRNGLESRFANVSAAQYALPKVRSRVMTEYIQTSFTQLDWRGWSESDAHKTIAALIKTAGGLFIWITTLCSFLEDQRSYVNPQEVISALLESGNTNNVLAHLYHTTVKLRFPESEQKTSLKKYLGGVLVLQEPLSIANFASLVSLDVTTIRDLQTRLIPLQTGMAKGPQNMIYPASHTFHLSFLEYVQGIGVPDDLKFTVNAYTTHSHIAEACLKKLDELSSTPKSPSMLPHQADASDAASLSPLEAYVTRYWPVHTASGTPAVTTASDVEWKATTHSQLMESLTTGQWYKWAILYVQLVDADSGIDPTATPPHDVLRNSTLGQSLAKDQDRPPSRLQIVLRKLKQHAETLIRLFKKREPPFLILLLVVDA
jgi:NACHT domain